MLPANSQGLSTRHQFLLGAPGVCSFMPVQKIKNFRTSLGRVSIHKEASKTYPRCVSECGEGSFELQRSREKRTPVDLAAL